MTEDEEAELLSFTGKTIDGKLYVDFEDFGIIKNLFCSKFLIGFLLNYPKLITILKQYRLYLTQFY